MTNEELFNKLAEVITKGPKPSKNEMMKDQATFQHGSNTYTVKDLEIRNGKLILIG